MSAIANSNQPEGKPKSSRVQAYWQNINWKKLASLVTAIALCFYLTACGDNSKSTNKASVDIATASIVEVSPPTEIQRLSRLLDQYEPKVNIVSPKADEVLNDDQVAVKLDVKNLPVFKNADFGLGPHIHVTLDNQEYKPLYDLNQTATFDHLSAGTHTIRAFASRPWHESFKNEGAYAQTTFHVLTKTGENTPEAKTPLLTYSRPVGAYGAEPILLDFYLQNAPLHLLGKDDEVIDDWQVRATVDGQSFTFDRWEPIYLKGFKAGQNWVKLELLEPDGDAIANVFNSTAHLINYQPNGTDTLARLVRGEKIANIEAIVNPDYVPPAPEVIPAPVESVEPSVTTDAKTTETPKTEVATPVTTPKEEAKPADKAPSVIPVAPITTKAAPVKAAPVTEPIKATSLKVKAAPVVVEPVKPVVPVKVKTAPVVEPVKAIAPKSKFAPIATPKPVTQVAPTVESAKNAVPEKTITAPTTSKDYLKNYFGSRNTPATKTDISKPIEKPAVKIPASKPETKPEEKSTDNPPALTNLSTTTSTPIKVLTNSGK